MRIFLAALLALMASGASAQMIQSGPVTPGHVPYAIQGGAAGAAVWGDGGSALDGKIKELGITNTGTPFCINDAPRTGPYHQLCLGTNSLGDGLLSFNAYGGATPLPITCNINGVTQSCFNQTPGVYGPTASQLSYVPIWGGTAGSLLSSGSPTSHFKASAGAVIDRMGDRVFIGGPANVNDGNQPEISKDWLEALRVNTTSLATLSSLSQIGAIAGIFGTRASDGAGDGEALVAFAINDFTGVCAGGTGNCSSWAAYLETWRKLGSTQQTIGIEVDPVEMNNVTLTQGTMTSYAVPLYLSAGVWIASGGGENTFGYSVYPASVAIGIVPNGSTFRSGIEFLTGSLGPATSDHGFEAIGMPGSYSIAWYEPATQQVAAFITSSMADSLQRMSLIFWDGLLAVSGSDSASVAIGAQPGKVSEVTFGNAVSSGPPSNQYSLGQGASGQFFMNTGGTQFLSLNGMTSQLSLGAAGASINLNAPLTNATAAGAFSAQRRIQLNVNGTTFYVPAMTTTW